LNIIYPKKEGDMNKIKFCGFLLLTVLTSILTGETNKSNLYLEFSGVAGYYYLPEYIRGNMEDYYNYSGYGEIRPAYLEATSSVNGYTQKSYHYEHPFANENRKNAGIQIQATYFFNSYLGAGFDYSHSFSLYDYYADHVYTDTLLYDSTPYPYYIPTDSASRYDYQVQFITSHDQLYVKQSTAGLALAMRKAILPKLNLHFRLGFGLADYLQVFRIEYRSVTAKNYLIGTGEIKSESLSPRFDTFGINYSAFYFCPKIALERPVTKQLSIRAGVEFPASYIEKGKEWRENNSDYGYVYYPETRFFASNPSFTVGLGVNF
jgi:hypothetical protein